MPICDGYSGAAWRLSDSVLRWRDAEQMLRHVSPEVARVLDELVSEWEPGEVRGPIALADVAHLEVLRGPCSGPLLARQLGLRHHIRQIRLVRP